MSDGAFDVADEIDIALLRHIDAVCTEFDQQWRAGLSPHIEDFLGQIPAPGFRRGLFELIEVERELRRKAGESVDIESYLSRFPGHDALIKKAFVCDEPTLTLSSAAAKASILLDRASPGVAEVPSALGRFQIHKEIGHGSFGIVYLATDPTFPRLVALKVPRDERVRTGEQRHAFVRDAQIAATLNHPGVVTIYEIATAGDSADDLPFIVQEYMPGGDIKQRLRSGSLTQEQAVAWMIPIAEAVAAAHQKNIVHRDLKPANILLDERGQPRVADFGLAVHERDLQKRGDEFAGTLPYMSPEQVRRESNRLDGRSDTWSLGIIFYEMLTGRRPYLGSNEEILEQIKYRDPRPLRELRPELPAELERICLKCLEKPAARRYSTALDLAQDLRIWQADEQEKGTENHRRGEPHEVGPPLIETPPRIVPKGLRSFDSRDADFFLELLPGPRDRDGLPESVRFWKALIEETDPFQTFTVGVLHGPSGCGKSSFLKAGVLPKLATHVVPVFIEATAADTEVRLLRGLRTVLPEIPRTMSLPDVLAGIRDGIWGLRKKILIAIDQFEQWLHAGNTGGPSQLVDALRHCDGEHLQCLILVREDFWTGISRIMQQLEIPLQEQRNAALVDRFDPFHARRVLEQFGRAYGRLPENPVALTGEQEQFLDEAIEQLSEEGRVICVRLALFSDLFQGKSWTPAALHRAGGADGLGVTFLEETFAAKSALTVHRRHCDSQAVQKLLAQLLPGDDTDIKGGMRTRDELQRACGYADKPRAFAELIHILDEQLRLVTPTDPEGSFELDAPASALVAETPQYYQFTHDYLVPSVRRWLKFKEAETLAGRTKQRLIERASLWKARPEDRHLPSLWEHIQIRLLTSRSLWSEPQQKMLRRAAWVHGMRTALTVLLFAAIVWGSLEGYQRLKVGSLRDRLFGAPAADLDQVISEMKPYRRWLQPLLADGESDPEKMLRISLFRLATGDAGQVNYLLERALNSQPDQLQIIREALHQYHSQLSAQLWDTLRNIEGDRSQRFRAACMLAEYAPQADDWPSFAPDIAAMLTSENPQLVADWSRLLRPARTSLREPLIALFYERQGQPEGYQAAGVLASYLDDDLSGICGLVLDANARQLRILLPKVAEQADKGRDELQKLQDQLESDSKDKPERRAMRKANLILALDRVGRTDVLIEGLRAGEDNQVQTQLIHRIGDSGVPARDIVKMLRRQEDLRGRKLSEYRPDVQQAVLLSLGEYPNDSLPESERRLLQPELQVIYETHPDCGVHSAAEWLLTAWDYKPKEIKAPRPLGSNAWYLTSEGHVMAVIRGNREFMMGGGEIELMAPHRRIIPRDFAISTKKVTNQQFGRFATSHLKDWKPSGDPACPATNVAWFDALKYCRWLAEQEKEKAGFPARDQGQSEVPLESGSLNQPGFRLPSEGEWEYACRAGCTSSRYFGDDEKMLEKYVWFVRNAAELRPVGTLKPNRFGLFDVFGNASELCQSQYAPYPLDNPKDPVPDNGDASLPSEGTMMIIRGCSWQATSEGARAYHRVMNPAARPIKYCGFRIAQTLSATSDD